MSSPNFAPSLPFERTAPYMFVYLVLGHSELSTVGLPGATSGHSGTNQHLRLLIRLRWVLQASLRRASTPPSIALPEPAYFPREVLTGILVYACDISGSMRLDREGPSQYNILRRITLQFLTSATRLLTGSGPVLSQEEVDYVRNQIEDMVQAWSKNAPLSLVEASIIKEVLAILSASCLLRDIRQSLASAAKEPGIINAAFDDLLGLSSGAHSNRSTSFWVIHDWIINESFNGRPESRTPDTVLAVYREALSKLRARPDHHYSFPLAMYMLEEVALHVSTLYQLLPHEQLIAENPLLNGMPSILSEEALAFNACFPEHMSLIEKEMAPPPSSPSNSLPPSPSPKSPSRSETQSPTAYSPIPPRKTISVYTSLPPSLSASNHASNIGRDAYVSPSLNEVRAYRDTGPVELPTRKPTRKPTPQSLPPGPPAIEIEGGLEVVETRESSNPPDFEKMMGQSQLGLRRLSVVPDGDARSISNLSSAGTVSSRTKRSLFGRFGSSRRPSLSPLPASLEFCFSSSAKQILFWCKKNPDSVIRLQYPNQDPERYEMLIPPDTLTSVTKVQNRSIRLLAAISNLAVALVHIEETRWLYILRDDFHPVARVHESIPAVLSISLSNDGRTVALGCGHYVLCYRLLEQQLTGPWRLDLNLNLGTRVVRLHRMSFSPDSRRLISAVQTEHSTHKHAVFVSIWSCAGQNFRLEAQLDPLYLTVGYADDTGISAILLTGPSDALAVQQAFLTAALSKSYPSILPIVSGMRNQHLDLNDKRIDNAAQCPSTASPHLCAIRAGRNKIFVVDTRTGTIEKAADFSAERKGLHLRHEHVALGMQGPSTVVALWRAADENLILKSVGRGADGKWTVQTTELGMVYRQTAGLLS